MNVLLVRIDGVGDALVCAPLIAALRAAGHRVGALLSTRNAGAFAPGVFDAVHVVERIPWPRHGSTPASYAGALADARAACYEVALVASEEPEAYRFARACGARRRIGFTNGFEKPLKSLWARGHLTRALPRETSADRVGEHEVETLFRLGAGLHAEAQPTRELGRLRWLVALREAKPADLIVLQVARKAHASEAGRAAFAALAQRIGKSHPIALFAAGEDAALARELGAPHDLVPSVFERVEAWRDALVGARAVVTPDGGAAHLAGMAGVPCVDIFEAGPHSAFDVRRWRPWAGPARTLVGSPIVEQTARDADAALHELLQAAPVPA